MLHDVIDDTLEQLTPEELDRLYWSVDVWERAGQMTAGEAVAWRERIRVWQRFREDAIRHTGKGTTRSRGRGATRIVRKSPD